MYTVITFYRTGIKANEASFRTKTAADRYLEYASRFNNLIATIEYSFEEDDNYDAQ